MFIRENKNRSGSISVQVIEKRRGKNKVVFSAGSSAQVEEIELLKIKVQEFIDKQEGNLPLFVERDDMVIQAFVASLSNNSLRIVGPQMVLGPIYDLVFPNITHPHFKDLVLCRVIYPGSKLRTVSYLSRHFNTPVSEQTIYRAMDQLGDPLKGTIEACTFTRAKQHSKDEGLSLVFYDMTTLFLKQKVRMS